MSIPMETITSDAQLNAAGFYWRETDGVNTRVELAQAAAVLREFWATMASPASD